MISAALSSTQFILYANLKILLILKCIILKSSFLWKLFMQLVSLFQNTQL